MRTVTLLGLVFALGCAGTSNSGVGVGGASSSSAGSPDTTTIAAASGAAAGAVGGAGGTSSGAGGTSSGAGGRPQCPQATMSVPPSGDCDFPGKCRPLKPVAQVCCPPGGCGPAPNYFDCSCGANLRLLCVGRYAYAQDPTTCISDTGEAGASSGGQAGAPQRRFLHKGIEP
jgi:hypothetical protein